MKPIKLLALNQATWGPGGTPHRWVAWFEGDEEKEGTPRAYGATAREARKILEEGLERVGSVSR